MGILRAHTGAIGCIVLSRSTVAMEDKAMQQTVQSTLCRQKLVKVPVKCDHLCVVVWK